MKNGSSSLTQRSFAFDWTSYHNQIEMEIFHTIKILISKYRSPFQTCFISVRLIFHQIIINRRKTGTWLSWERNLMILKIILWFTINHQCSLWLTSLISQLRKWSLELNSNIITLTTGCYLNATQDLVEKLGSKKVLFNHFWENE